MKKSIYLLHFLVLPILFSGFSVSGQTPNYVPTDNLEAWWPFNVNAVDESFTDHDGTVHGAELTTDRFDIPGKAYNFNGVDNNITTDFAPVLGNQARTISFWFFSPEAILPNGHIHGAELGMVCWGGSGSNNQGRGFATVMMDNNQPGLDINTAYKACNVNTLGYWNHYVVSFSPTNGSSLQAVKLYLNGYLVSDISRTFNISTNINTVDDVKLMFGSTITAGQYFKGKLDDIGIWSRELTDAEILELYYASEVDFVAQPLVGSNPGTLAKIRVRSIGTATSFNWQVKVGNTYNTVTNSSTYMGQGTNTLSIVIPADSNFNGRTFRCIVARQNRTDTSSETSINVVTSTKKGNDAGKISLYPNPARDQFRIFGIGKGSDVKLIDNLGRERTLELIGNDVFSLRNIEKGIYFARFTDNQGISDQRKLIVW